MQNFFARALRAPASRPARRGGLDRGARLIDLVMRRTSGAEEGLIMAKRKSAKKAKAKSEKKSRSKTGSEKKAASSPKKAPKSGKSKGDKKGDKKGAKKARKADELAPRPVASGRGASPGEVGAGLVEMVRAGAPEREIWDRFFSRKFVSIEGGMAQAWHGRAAVQAKADWWHGAHKVHSIEADGPYVGATGFGVRFTIDAEDLATGDRFKGDELAFYTVKNGKIIQEEFMGRPMPQDPHQECPQG